MFEAATLALLVTMGGVTLLLQDEIYIKWKSTVFFWVLAVAFLGSQFIGHKTLVQRFFDSKFEPPAKVWTVLNLAWIVFFLCLGALNRLMFIFIFAQILYLFRYMIPDEDAEEQG